MKLDLCRGHLHRLQAPLRGCRWGGALLTAVALAGALLPRPARAQVPDLVEVGAQYLPEASLQDPRPAKAQVSSYDAAVNLPWVLGETTFLVPGLAYHVDSISYADAPAGFQELRAFHSLDLALLFVQLLGADWAVSLRVAPGLAGDFASVGRPADAQRSRSSITRGRSAPARRIARAGSLARASAPAKLPDRALAHVAPSTGAGESNQPSHSLTRASRVLSTLYTRVRPRLSC